MDITKSTMAYPHNYFKHTISIHLIENLLVLTLSFGDTFFTR